MLLCSRNARPRKANKNHYKPREKGADLELSGPGLKKVGEIIKSIAAGDRFLTYLDDTQYKRLKSALDLRNGCGHPTGYQPDPVKLQVYYADITQLVLLNPKFA
jgi:hypothetical protein